MKKLILILSLLFTFNAHAAEEKPMPKDSTTKSAIFAGGCFWCMEPAFDNTEGVTDTIVGYIGGSAETAHYEMVSRGNTGHFESIEVVYDPKKVSYEHLLEVFWGSIDPFDHKGQFADKGSQYHTAIFYNDEAEKKLAETSKAGIEAKFPDKTIAPQILPVKPFYAAEEYHQNYYLKNSGDYNAYKYGSGRATGLERIWGE
jgi:peptide-methionine (S)-S-oxide reductase